MTLTKIGASLGGAADTLLVTQAGHGFVSNDIGKAVKLASTGLYELATAGATTTADAIGIIVQRIDANTLLLALSGRITVDACVPTGTPGTVLFLPLTSTKTTNVGYLTATEPSQAGEVSKPMAVITISGSEMILFQMRGEVITTGTISIADGSIDNDAMADNAINTDEIVADAVTNAKLANTAAYTVKGNATGSPANPTDISLASATGGYSIHDNDIVLTYDADGSALKTITRGNFLSGVGGTSVAGTTDNGILTFVNSSSTFAAESGFTFDGSFAQITGNFNNYSDGPLRIKTTNASGYCPISFYSNDDTLLATFRPQVSNGHLSIASAGNINFSAGDANADAVTHMKILTTGDITLKENNSYNISIPKGLAKAWGMVRTATDDVTIRYNIDQSGTNVGTGLTTITFTTDMENTDYSCVGSTNDGVLCFNSKATGSVRVDSRSYSGSGSDSSECYVAFFGQAT